MKSTLRFLAVSSLFAATQLAAAQCVEQWQPMPGVTGGASPGVFAMAEWDPDGGGPQSPLVIVAGAFTTAGNVAANNIAAWDGANFAALGPGLDGEVYSLAVLPSGLLVAGGAFATSGGNPVGYVAQWDGTTWSSLAGGMNNGVNDITTTTGGDLVAGGFFSTAGGISASRIARWNGTAWAPLGSGMNNIVYAVRGLQNGSVVAGGMFTTAGGTIVNRIARWNGTAWVGMGGANSNVLSFSMLSNGDLIVGGQFTLIGTAAANRIARYSSAGLWSAFGSGLLGVPRSVVEVENGDLIIGGQFFTPTSNIARWNASGWSSLGGGTDSGVFAMHVEPSGDILVGGLFQNAGAFASPCLARWAAAAPPHVSTQPVALVRCANGDATFHVVATGSPTLVYEWYRDDQLLTDGASGTGSVISGATTASVTIGGLCAADVGNYYSVVANACGTATSDSASLSIIRGDLNADGRIDLADLAILLAHFGMNGASPSDGDLDGDSVIGLTDLAIELSAFGTDCP